MGEQLFLFDSVLALSALDSLGHRVWVGHTMGLDGKETALLVIEVNLSRPGERVL